MQNWQRREEINTGPEGLTQNLENRIFAPSTRVPTLQGCVQDKQGQTNVSQGLLETEDARMNENERVIS